MKHSAIIAQLASDLSNAETEIAELREDLAFEHNESARLRNEVLALKEQLTAKLCQLSELAAKVKTEKPVDSDPAARATAYMVREGARLQKTKVIFVLKEVMKVTGWRIEPAMNWITAFMDAYQSADSIPVEVEEPAPITMRSQERMTA